MIYLILYLLLGVCTSIIDRLYIAKTPQHFLLYPVYWCFWPFMLLTANIKI